MPRPLLEHLASSWRGSASRISNRAPVPYVARNGELAGPWFRSAGPEAGLAAYGADATLFAIVSGSAESQSQVDWHLYRKAASGKKEDRTEVPANSHPSIALWNKPNPFFTRQEFVETGGQHFELTGEQYWVLDMSPGFPLEMWPVRPDRMRPNKSRSGYLTGWDYVYDGEEIPLELSQVIQIRRPDPNDMYRGMSACIPALRDVDTNKLAAEWARNFFYNNAQPGGMIEYDRTLEDWEFKQVLERWREQHKGVSNAHRVGVVEGGKWVDTKYSIKDMDFTALRQFSAEQIRIAFRYPKFMLGTMEDANRATAEASEYIYAKWFVVTRLERIKAALNNDLLPKYGPNDGKLYEWDYDSPVPEDQAAIAASVTAKSNAAKVLVGMGYDHTDVEAWLEMPAMAWEKPAPPPVLQVATGGGDGGKADEKPAPPKALLPPLPRNVLLPSIRAAEDLPPDQLPPLDETQASWEDALAALLVAYGAVTLAQQLSLLALVRDLASHGQLDAIASWTISTEQSADVITPALSGLARIAVQEAVAEAAAQSVELPTVVADPVRLAALGEAYAELLAREHTLSAAGEATRLFRPGVGADELEAGVRDHLESLTDARPRLYLGGALTAAQNSGRISAFLAGPTAAYYANETLDQNTCEPCREVNGRWLGNSILRDVVKTYPTGGYVDCLGRLRCRGQVSAVWRPETTGGGR